MTSEETADTGHESSYGTGDEFELESGQESGPEPGEFAPEPLDPEPFALLGLAPTILRDITAAGLINPTPIQRDAIPPLLEGRDLIGLAQTGTGKTAAYLLPLLQGVLQKRKDGNTRHTSILILAPTRELAHQIAESIKTFSRSLKVRYLTICGGERYDYQIRALKKGVDVIVATPGRFEDLHAKGQIDLAHIEHFVLDEADQMVDLGFFPAIKRIFESLPGSHQTALFSATMPPEMKQLAETFLTDALTITAERAGETADAISQRAILVSNMDKREVLVRELGAEEDGQVLVFVRTKLRADDLATTLSRAGISADALHGDMRQAIRLKVLRKFKRGELRVLVATDVAARGIDVTGLGLVINFDLPETVEAYVHRIGRTGRAGAEGVALSICSVADQEKLGAIQGHVGQRLEIVNTDGDVVEDFQPERAPGKKRGRPPRRMRQGGRPGRPSAPGGKKPGRPKPRMRTRTDAEAAAGTGADERPSTRQKARQDGPRKNGARKGGPRKEGFGKEGFGKDDFRKDAGQRGKGKRNAEYEGAGGEGRDPRQQDRAASRKPQKSARRHDGGQTGQKADRPRSESGPKGNWKKHGSGNARLKPTGNKPTGNKPVGNRPAGKKSTGNDSVRTGDRKQRDTGGRAGSSKKPTRPSGTLKLSGKPRLKPARSPARGHQKRRRPSAASGKPRGFGGEGRLRRRTEG